MPILLIVRLALVLAALAALVGPTTYDLDPDASETPPTAEPSGDGESESDRRPTRRERRTERANALAGADATQPRTNGGTGPSAGTPADEPGTARPVDDDATDQPGGATDGNEDIATGGEDARATPDRSKGDAPTVDDDPSAREAAAREAARRAAAHVAGRDRRDGEAIIGTIDPDRPFDPADLPDSIRRSLPRGSSGPTLLASGSPTAGVSGADQLTVEQGCHLQCITSGVAYARGVDAELVVTTSVPATIRLDVYGGPSVQTFTSPAGSTSFATMVEGLEPGTEYHVLARATDGDGHMAQALGSFTTLRRNVTLTFHHTELLEVAYTGTFHAHAKVDGQWLAPIWDIPYAGGIAFLGPLVEQRSNVDRELEVGFQLGQIHDHDSPGCEPVQWHFPKPDSAGTSCTSVYNTLSPMVLDLDARPANASSWLSHDYWLTPTSSIDAPSFRLHLHVQVEYVA